MKRALIAAAILATAFTVPAWAADGNQPAKAAQPDFKERKAQMLKGMDERISGLQQEKKCVQGAKSDDDLNACREKLRAQRDSRREEMRAKRHSMRSAPTRTAGK